MPTTQLPLVTLLLLFCLLTCLAIPPAHSAAPQTGLKEDQLRALPNNSAPPERRVPHSLLPPLSSQEEGTIRRVQLPDNAKLVALTFDLCELDTSTSGYDAAIIDFLRQERIPATLFMGGKWMRTHSARVLELMGEPLFSIANHAWSHGNFGIMSVEKMREQVLWTQAQYEILREEALRRAATAGRSLNLPPVPTLFRLPYGRCSEQALHLLAELGMHVIQWDVVAESSADNSLPGLGQEVAARTRPGSILLFHANLVPKGSASLLRDTVRALQAHGYSFISVTELLSRGTAQRNRDGYFNTPGDNLSLDTRFGVDGTGRK